MSTTISYLLILQKYINLKQDSEIKKKIPYVKEIFQEMFQLITWKKTGLNGYVYDFSVDYRAFDIINIHKYLMKKHDMK